MAAILRYESIESESARLLAGPVCIIKLEFVDVWLDRVPPSKSKTFVRRAMTCLAFPLMGSDAMVCAPETFALAIAVRIRSS